MQRNDDYVMVGIGEVLWDLLPDGRQLGGAPANFAYHATQLGNRGVVVSSVGSDEDGEEILETLEKKRVDNMVTFTKEYPTGTVSVEMSSGGVPSYTIHENVAWDHLQLEERHFQLAKEADAVCFGTLAQRNEDSARMIRQFLEATTKNCLRLFDINLRQHYYSGEMIERLLDFATVLKLNDEELDIVKKYFGLGGDETDILKNLGTTHSLDLIILTKGQQGSRLYSPRLGDSHHGGESVEVADTVGAGDSFAAAVATGMLMEMPLQTIHELAEKVAAYVCTRSGATPQLPSMDEFI